MMSCSRINHLLKCTSQLNRNFNRECNWNALGETVLRTTCTISGTKNLHGIPQHNKSLCLPVKAPALQSLVEAQRCVTTVAGRVSQPGVIKRFIKKMGWLDHSRSKLRRSGFLLYELMGVKVEAMEFFEVCELPDTFYSWFLVTELHTWMMMVRLMAEGEEGRYVRNCLIEAMWEDLEMRAKKLGNTSSSSRNEQIQEIASSFQAALFTYDEGLLSDDKVLASALWRRLFAKNCTDPERLECCVQYVRKQMAYLDSLSSRQILLDCEVEWIHLLETE